jgi:subtilisin family serine protease
MANDNSVYTYRNGKKIMLSKKDNQFVVRATPTDINLDKATNTEKLGSQATRMTVLPADLETMMTQNREIAPTHHAYSIADTDEDFIISDRIIVTFKKDISDEDLVSFEAKYGLIRKSVYSPRDFLFQLTIHTGMNPVKLVVKITEEEKDTVALVEHDLTQRMKMSDLTLPSDPVYNRQWHLHQRLSHPDVDVRSSSRCESAWQLANSFGSSDVVIGLSDDGCKLDHPDFNSVNKFAGWGYFQGDSFITMNSIDAVPSNMYQSGANHGTACAGVIAGEADGVLTVGAAPACRLVPIKWESDGFGLFVDDSKLMATLNYIADKVDVFSNSWGSTPSNLFATVVVERIRQLAINGGRRGKGIVFLWAAGNENCPINHTGTVQIPYSNGWRSIAGSWQWVGVRRSRTFESNLVNVPGVMYVAALASTAQRSHYSNYGNGIAICGPTSNGHTYWRGTARGLGISTTTGEASQVDDEFGGTSSATPLVAGIAGLVISANPDLTALEVISILKKTASKDLNMNGYPRSQPMAADPDTSWDISPISPHNTGNFTDIGSSEGTWSSWFGHGKVDAEAAVRRAIELRVAPVNIAPVTIVSALINPVGFDANKEKVTLRNNGTSEIILTDWKLVNQLGKSQSLTGSIAVGNTKTINLNSNKINLLNTGGQIILKDIVNNTVHSVSYTAAQAVAGVNVIF